MVSSEAMKNLRGDSILQRTSAPCRSKSSPAMFFFSSYFSFLTGVAVAQCSLAPKLRRYVSMMTRAPTPGHMLKEVQTLAGKEGVLDCPGLSEAAKLKLKWNFPSKPSKL